MQDAGYRIKDARCRIQDKRIKEKFSIMNSEAGPREGLLGPESCIMLLS